MSLPSGCRIHPTAVISPEVQLGENVSVGAHVIIDGQVEIGDDCELRPGAYLFGPLKMGRANRVFPGAILGEAPQHLKYNDEPTSVEIGHGNIFREHVTVHRGTTHSMKTVIGNDNFLMANSHVAHDCVLGNRCVLANGAVIGGHCTLEDGVILSGNSAVHQFVRIGRLAMISGCSATSKDVPPFILQQGVNGVVGINVVGMKRAGMSRDQMNSVRIAFKILFREGLGLPAAMARLERDLGQYDAVQEMLTFLRGCTNGINFFRHRFHEEMAA
ncbi:MAG: acyl-ACP--UDP-N-acetylglucosamine O-acyltransferase [Planctomycetes bacterium]|nr:acyl-ACP--UDP-N-acetylglucosamine O-acyltransferase [Planctomycetota bacterium]